MELGKYEILISIIAPPNHGKTSLMLKYLSIVKNYDDVIYSYLPLKRVFSPVSRILNDVIK